MPGTEIASVFLQNLSDFFFFCRHRFRCYSFEFEIEQHLEVQYLEMGLNKFKVTTSVCGHHPHGSQDTQKGVCGFIRRHPVYFCLILVKTGACFYQRLAPEFCASVRLFHH
jgi:hypothetical protein